MSQVRVLTPEHEQRVVEQQTCWALWREDLPCRNRATWLVRNRTNAGYSLMCDVHKDGFAAAQPLAAVEYVHLEAEHV